MAAENGGKLRAALYHEGQFARTPISAHAIIRAFTQRDIMGSRMDVLLIGAVGMLFSALVLAWIATFAKLIVVQPVKVLIKDYDALIRAHIDLLLMSLLCLAIFAIRVPVPTAACWMVVIGGFTNPSLFLLRALDPVAPITWRRQAFRLVSFGTTTVGFGWVGCSLLRAVQ